MKTKNTGFTLIEIMIVVAIVGLLAAAAIPNYQRYVLEARRADATKSIMDCAAAQFRFRSLNNSFSVADAAGNPGICPTSSRDGYYTIAVTVGPDPAGTCVTNGPGGINNINCFLITATIPVNHNITGTPNVQVNDQAFCTTFTLNHLSVKRDTGTASSSLPPNGLGVGNGRCWRS